MRSLPLPLTYWHVIPSAVSHVQLARPGDPLLLVHMAFLPLGQPPRCAPDGEQDGEYLDREAHRLVDDPGIEVNVGIELV